MSKSIHRSYSGHGREAVKLLGTLIRAARKERKMTAHEIAERAGISRGLVQRIEKGDMKCEIGAAFEVATIVGIRLFDADDSTLSARMRQTEEKLALLPKTVRKKVGKIVDDDF
jgi:transcriptional regulator with XRE-family HTH domain